MKSQYFTDENIQEKAKEFLAKLELRQRKQVMRKPALLVLDMQKYFLESNSHAFVPSGPAIISGIIELIGVFLDQGHPVFLTKHINTSEDAGEMATWWKDLILKDSRTSELDEQLQNLSQPIIEKTQYDAFYLTNLDKMLKSQQVTDVIITGVMTHLCCETTARSAFMHGYRVWFPIEGTATYNEDFHTATLQNLSHGFANVLLMDELKAKLTQEQGKAK